MNSIAITKRAVICAAMLVGANVGCDSSVPPGYSGPQRLEFNARASGYHRFALHPNDEYPKDYWVPGVDYARISFGEWNDGEIAFVVWTDLGSPGGSGGGDRYDGSVHGNHRSTDPDRRIEYECSLADRQDKNSATMIIDGQNFPLSQGRLFLVSTTTGETIIRQLKRDIPLIGEGDHQEEYRKMIESDTEMQEFFRNPDGGM